MATEALLESSPEAVPDQGVLLYIHKLMEQDGRFPFRCSKFYVDCGARTSLDSHAVCELWFIASGDVAVYIEGQSHAAAAGDVVRFKPWQKHFMVNTGASTALIFSVWWS